MKKLLRIGEASQILGVSVSTLRRWEKEGKLKPIRIGKERRYDY
ncbi:MAG: IS607 family transposase, partial [Persephonella sp.]